MQRSGQSSKIRRLLFDPHSASLRQAFVQGKTSLDMTIASKSIAHACPKEREKIAHIVLDREQFFGPFKSTLAKALRQADQLNSRNSQSAVPLHRVAAFCFARRAISLPQSGVCARMGKAKALHAGNCAKSRRFFFPCVNRVP